MRVTGLEGCVGVLSVLPAYRFEVRAGEVCAVTCVNGVAKSLMVQARHVWRILTRLQAQAHLIDKAVGVVGVS